MNDPRELSTRDRRPHTVKRRGDLILRYVGDDTAAITGNPYAVRRVDEHATGDSLFDGAVQLASGTLGEMESFFQQAISTRRVAVNSEPAPDKFVYGVFLASPNSAVEHVELIEIMKPQPITDFEIDNLISLYARARGIDVSFLYVALKTSDAAEPTLRDAAEEALAAIEQFQTAWDGNLTNSASALTRAKQALKRALK